MAMFFIEQTLCIKSGDSEILSHKIDSMERIANFSQKENLMLINHG